jgi:sugar-specific transcriptional regulator TrmB
MTRINDIIDLFKQLGLQEYHAKAMAHLVRLGRTTAPELSKASRVPKARIYEVLSDLADMGYIEVFSGRPMQYKAKAPNDILKNKMEFEKRSYESSLGVVKKVKKDFIETLTPLHLEAEKGTEETQLLSIVKVGEPSNRQTRLMYGKARKEINICSKVFEYFPEVKDRLQKAMRKGVEIKILMLTSDQLTKRSRDVQKDIIGKIKKAIPKAKIRFSRSKLPLRGSMIDPSYEYKGGSAIFLVEEKEVPLYLRDAAVTSNPSLVAGMKKYFDLIWKYESRAKP